MQGGILSPLLAVLFIGLKLTGHIDWSWMWVLSPIWITLSLVFVILIIYFILDYKTPRYARYKR